MAIRLPSVLAEQHLRRSVFAGSKAASRSVDIPKGFLAVYVGGAEKKRYVAPVSYLNKPSFQGLLGKAEDELCFDHPLPRRYFSDVASSLSRL